MTIDKVIEYILHTPYNTNRAILMGILKSLILNYGGSLGPDYPERPEQIIYDGGVEE